MLPQKIENWLKDYMVTFCTCSDCGKPIAGKRNKDGSIYCPECQEKRNAAMINTILAVIGLLFLVISLTAIGAVCLMKYLYQ